MGNVLGLITSFCCERLSVEGLYFVGWGEGPLAEINQKAARFASKGYGLKDYI